MTYVYKIWGGYDGFRPNQVPHRLDQDGLLPLRWERYGDVVAVGDDVWVYFFEGQRFEPGIYARGTVERVAPTARLLWLRLYEQGSRPLTSPRESERIREVVRPRKRQVFLLPTAAKPPAGCTVQDPDAPSCAAARCGTCPWWQSLPLVNPHRARLPTRLRPSSGFTGAYWVLVNRSFVYQAGRRPLTGVKRASDLFMRFKLGEMALAYPLAKGLQRALAQSGHRPDFLVPVPLSPEKATRDEAHRVLELGTRLGKLLGVPVEEALTLSSPAGRRDMRNAGYTPIEFERLYAASSMSTLAASLRARRSLCLTTWRPTAAPYESAFRRLKRLGPT